MGVTYFGLMERLNSYLKSKTSYRIMEGLKSMAASQTLLEEKQTLRMEAFSDGVFAIAITLLVLGIRVPLAHDLEPGQSLIQVLLSQWPSFVSYLISFFTILIMWIQHHRLFMIIKRNDLGLAYLNGFLLLLVAFVPFPTAVLGEHIQSAGAKTATLLYTGTFVLIAVAFNLFWHYAAWKRRLLGKSVPQKVIDDVTRQYWLGPPVYLISFLFGFVSVPWSLGTCVFLDLFFAITACSNFVSE